MIREYAPIGLIPAAWVMTVLTVSYPGIDSYWIRHMHYFIVIFLAGFTLLSWGTMGENAVLDIWRAVIAAGVVFTGLGAVSFSVESYSAMLSGASLGYWLVVPGVACYLSAGKMKGHTRAYRAVGYAGFAALILSSAGLTVGLDAVTTIGFGVAAVSQSYSILVAASMDGNLGLSA